MCFGLCGHMAWAETVMPSVMPRMFASLLTFAMFVSKLRPTQLQARSSHASALDLSRVAQHSGVKSCKKVIHTSSGTIAPRSVFLVWLQSPDLTIFSTSTYVNLQHRHR